jgi:ubiquinone/menaquinone biosynthesis C-methylase UbiE
VLLARQGCHVTGIDIAPLMLAQAARRVRQEGVGDGVDLQELGAVDLDVAFSDAGFDAVVSTLVFSELAPEVIVYVLRECQRVLRAGGQLFVADEILPDSKVGRVATFLFRLPFVVIAFLLTQNTTRRVSGLDEAISRAGFLMLEGESYLAGTLQLFVAQKAG